MNAKKIKHAKDLLDTFSKIYKNISTQHKELILKLICLIYDYDNEYIVKFLWSVSNEYTDTEEIILQLPEKIYLQNFKQTNIIKTIQINIDINYNMFLKEINKNIKIYKKIINTDIFPKIENNKITPLSMLDID
jgi:hypothetical protein